MQKNTPLTLIGTRADGRPIYAILGADHDAAQGDYLDLLNRQHNDHLTAIETLTRSALDAEGGPRELTPEELTEVERHQQAMAGLAPRIEQFEQLRRARVDSAARQAATPPVMRSLVPVPGSATPPGVTFEAPAGGQLEPVFRSAGEAAAAIIDARRGDSTAQELVNRAIQHQKTSNTPGLLPIPTIGTMRGLIDAPRRIVATATRLPLPPAGLEMKRPKITQHTVVGKQGTTSASEKTEVPSQAMTVEFDTFRLNTYGGAVNISMQDVERTDPGALELLYADLVQQYGVATEADMAAALVAATTATSALAANADLATLWRAVFAGAGQILTGTGGKLPDVIYASVDQWARIGGGTTPINAQNGTATAVPTELSAVVGNLQVVVAPALPAGTLILGRKSALEYVEGGEPVRLSVPEPRVLGYEVGVYGYFAPFVAQPSAFVKLAPAA